MDLVSGVLHTGDGALIPIDKCPVCCDNMIEWMPICHNEIYRLDYNPTSGLTLKFSEVEKSVEGDVNTNRKGER
jgi:hypothetical protein